MGAAVEAASHMRNYVFRLGVCVVDWLQGLMTDEVSGMNPASASQHFAQ